MKINPKDNQLRAALDLKFGLTFAGATAFPAHQSLEGWTSSKVFSESDHSESYSDLGEGQITYFPAEGKRQTLKKTLEL
jgi:hypothetical protein